MFGFCRGVRLRQRCGCTSPKHIGVNIEVSACTCGTAHREAGLHEVRLAEDLERVVASVPLHKRNLPESAGAQHRHPLQLVQHYLLGLSDG